MVLYQIAEMYRAFFEAWEAGAFADENGNDDGDALNDTFEGLVGAADEKLEAVGCFYKELKAEVDEMKKEEQAIAKRRKAKENRMESLKQYMIMCMNVMQYKRLDRPKVTISLRKSEAVAIDDIAQVPEEFLKVRTEVTADKDAIKQAYKAGVLVSGAHIEQRQSAVIG